MSEPVLCRKHGETGCLECRTDTQQCECAACSVAERTNRMITDEIED